MKAANWDRRALGVSSDVVGNKDAIAICGIWVAERQPCARIRSLRMLNNYTYSGNGKHADAGLAARNVRMYSPFAYVRIVS